MESSKTAVILLNWNGTPDTIACIESLLRMPSQDFVIVVCDNNSADGSFEILRQWGESHLQAHFAVWTVGREPVQQARVVLIQTGDNLGFAGGCNVGLRYALLHPGVQYLWLLNNDTVVAPNALALQEEAMEAKSSVGILGSTLIYFHDPDCVQAPGGYDFNFWTARVLVPFPNLTPASLPTESAVEARLKYISGASMFLRRSFVEQVGLLNEQYFLYFEEVDWAIRGHKHFRLGYCAASKILHKEGGSIGSHRDAQQRSSFSERYLARNRVLFLRTYFPWRLPICLLWIVAIGIVRTAKGNWKLAKVLWSGAFEGLRAPILPLPSISEWPATMHSA